MALPDISSLSKIASIGGGPIGGGWTAHFLARGFDVRAYLHDPAEETAFRDIIETAWPCLIELGLASAASLDRLVITSNLEDAIAGAEFIQESAVERLDEKQALYQKLGNIVGADIVIASSTSGLLMSDIQARCDIAARTLVGHPFNPPYLLPLVEVVGGTKTITESIDWAMAFYRHVGKEPLQLKREIPGFVATRLQEALWREALHMVANSEASPEDIDRALRFGPASRMLVQGQCMAFHVACGEGGMAKNLDQFGPALKLPWTRLDAPELTPELRNAMVDGCIDMAGNSSFKTMAAERDQKIARILKIVQQKG